MVDETILIANMMCQMFPEKKFLRENWKHENCLIVSCDFTADGLSKYFAEKMHEAGVRKTEIFRDYQQRANGDINPLGDRIGKNCYDVVLVRNVLEQARAIWLMVESIKSLINAGGMLIAFVRQERTTTEQERLLPPYCTEDEWRFSRETMEGLFADFQLQAVVDSSFHTEALMLFTRRPETVAVDYEEIPVYSYRTHDYVRRHDCSLLGYFRGLTQLSDLGLNTGTDKAYLFHNYLDKYEFFLRKFRQENIRILELGVFNGASEQMWESYFPAAEIYGVDINPDCREYETERIHILIKDLGCRNSLQELRQIKPHIIIDDASHIWSHQILALFMLFDALPSGGVYILEDMETSLDLPRYKVGNYDDFEIDAYTVCERIMRVAAAKIPEQRDGFSEQINAIGMNVELAAVMKGSCVLIKR